MNKLFLTCLLFVASLFGAGAAGTKGYLTLLGLQDYTVTSISPNGKWATGYFLNGVAATYGFRWNLETDECELLSTNSDISMGESVADDGTVVGEYTDYQHSSNGAPITAIGYYKDGSWHALEPIAGFSSTTPKQYDGYSLCISPDGRWIGGANYDKDGVWRPVIWKDGMVYKVLGTTTGTVQAISNDGTKAAGWADSPEYRDRRFTVIWDVEKNEVKYLSDKVSPFNEGIKFTSDGKYLLHTSIIDGQFRGHLYNTETGENTPLPYYGGDNTPWDISYQGLDDSLNVYGLEVSASQTSSYGTVTNNGKVQLLTDYLASRGFKLSDTGLSLVRLSNVTAVASDGMTMAVSCMDYDFYEHPLIIRFGQNGDTREPVALAATQATGLMATKLTWKAPLGNTEGLTGYNVYRDGVKLTEQPVTGNFYVDNNVSAGSYTYTVTALYGTVESVQSTAANVTIAEITPSAPRALFARQKGYNSAAIAWQAPATNLIDLKYYNPDADLIGFGGSENSFEFAVKYSKAELSAYNDYTISKVAFVPRTQQPSWVIKIYDGDSCIYQQPISQELKYGEENTVTLDKPISVASVNGDVTCAIAVTVDPTLENSNVVGMEEGNCQPGYSDLVHLSGETAFYSLSERSHEGGYSFDISFALSMIMSKNGDAADIDNVSGYNVYVDDAQVGTTSGSNYVIKNVADGDYKFGVEAVYSDGRVSPKSETNLTVKANEKVFTGITNVYYGGENGKVNFSWEAPVDNDMQNITYSGDNYAETIAGTENSNWGYIARSIYPSSMFKGLGGYTINKVRFYPVGSAYFTVYVYDDGELVSVKELDDDEYVLGQWNTITLDTPVVIDENSQYTLDIDCFDGLADQGPLAIDDQPYFPGYSQLASVDGGEEFGSLQGGTTGNWMMGLVAVAPDADPLPVDGYDVYIDAKKVNTTPVTETKYTYDFGSDAATNLTHRVNVNVNYTGRGSVTGSYVFFTLQQVAAGIESTLTADFSVYPNPATDYVVVNGEGVEEISAFSIGGALMGHVAGNRLDVSSYAPGLYILKVKVAGKVHSVKLNVIR